MSFINDKVKVIGYLGEYTNEKGEIMDKVVICFPKPEEYKGNPTKEMITIAHDYVRISGSLNIQQENIEGEYPVKKTKGAVNWINTTGSVTIGIRDMFEFMLPFLNQHPYLQKEHFKNRDVGTETEYSPYNHEACIIQYADPNSKKQMVAFRRVGENEFNHLDLSSFNLIKDSLYLDRTKKEIEEKNK